MGTDIGDDAFRELRSEYHIEIRGGSEDLEWDSFIAQAAVGSHLQTSLWGKVKEKLGWEAIRIILIEQERILCGAQLLIRKYIPGISICYITRGPIIRHDHLGLISTLLDQIIQYCRKKKITYLAIQPPVAGDYIIPYLEKYGFQPSELELAPTASILIDLSMSEDQLLKGMKRQTRQNVRRSDKEGIVIRVGSERDIQTFYKIHYETSNRQGFLAYEEAYLHQLWDTFNPGGHIALIFTEYLGEVVSGLLLIGVGGTVCAKLLGWSGKFAELRPNDGLFWGAIQWSKSNGYHYFDFEGIARAGALAWNSKGELPDEYRQTPDFMKIGYGGQVTIFPIAYDFVYNPILRSARKYFNLQVHGNSLSTKVIDWIRKR